LERCFSRHSRYVLAARFHQLHLHATWKDHSGHFPEGDTLDLNTCPRPKAKVKQNPGPPTPCSTGTSNHPKTRAHADPTAGNRTPAAQRVTPGCPSAVLPGAMANGARKERRTLTLLAEECVWEEREGGSYLPQVFALLTAAESQSLVYARRSIGGLSRRLPAQRGLDGVEFGPRAAQL
jgi:hypothetical protein